MFDTAAADDWKSLRSRIIMDNRKFSIIWSLVEILFGIYSLTMSFYKEDYRLCRDAYIWVIVFSTLAFLCAMFISRKYPLTAYLSMLLVDAAILGTSLLIAWILIQNGYSTIMVFAAFLIVPIFFVNNTLLNILIASLDIVAAVFLLREGFTQEDYVWCLTNMVIFAAMGIILGHFVNKARFERYVFAEAAVKLAESNATVAELQTKYAYYDQMTGLKNRRAYSEALERLEREAPASCWVIMMDSNGLKRINDTLGHFAGDEMIVGIAECLRRAFEGITSVFRLGGDEFCVVMEGTEQEVNDRLQAFEGFCGEWKGQYINGISVSYGSACTGEFPDTDALTKAADQRMYAFKSAYYQAAGKNR